MAPVPCRDRVIEAMPATAPELAAMTGLSRRTIWKWLNILRDEKICRIVGWRDLGLRGGDVAIHGMGRGPDKLRRKKVTNNKKRWKKYAAKLTDEQIEMRRKKDVARHSLKKARAKPNTWFGALPR